MYFTQKQRSSVAIDPDTCDPRMLFQGRVAWLETDGQSERAMVFWDVYEKRFLSAREFRLCKEKRAEENRASHALVPFGPLMRAARRRRDAMTSPALAWAHP